MKIIIDVNSIGTRIFFGIHYKRDIFDADTFYLTFIRKLSKLLAELPPGDVYLAVDSGKCWRKIVSADYKAGRSINKHPAYNDYINAYTDFLIDIKMHLPVGIVKVATYEADDILAYASCKFKDEQILLVSNDKDIAQLLINSNTVYYNFVDEQFVKIENPEIYINNMICRGDSGDGVASIVPKNSKGKAKVALSETILEKNYDPKAEFCINPTFINEMLQGKNKKPPKLTIDDIAYMRKKYKENQILIDLRYSTIHEKDLNFKKPDNFNRESIVEFINTYIPGAGEAENLIRVLTGYFTT